MNEFARTGYRFILLGFASLIIGLGFGSISSVQYVLPDFLKEQLSFQKTRPLHVYLVISWIFNCAAGIIYYYLSTLTVKRYYSKKFASAHFYLQLIILVVVVAGFLLGKFGGREYLEFPPWVVIIVIASWLCFMTAFFSGIGFVFKSAPLYIWSWSTGLIFFLVTITEAQLWQLPFFNNNIIRDTTVQWKALGSMVGSWNMLVYGTAMYVMEKITGDTRVNQSPIAFFFYFLGLTNLMFNWGHHTYIVPASPVVKNVAFIISMTELLILGKILFTWRKNYLATVPFEKHPSIGTYTWGDAWIFLNLVLAILISVPAVNLYTHGTHITVAHAMGATIGINTVLLLAAVIFVVNKNSNRFRIRGNFLNTAVTLMNIFLLIFWISLLGMGIAKALGEKEQQSFYAVMKTLKPWFEIFSISGVIVFIILGIIAVSLSRQIMLLLAGTGKDTEAEKQLTAIR
ncbi:MAG: cbb3-type cytochrome c oxidase subunit I [Ferruginibacter sp.]